MTRRAAGAGLLTALALITTQGELLVKKSRGSWSQSAKSYELFRELLAGLNFQIPAASADTRETWYRLQGRSGPCRQLRPENRFG
jgi:hypothetical protein